MADTTKVQVTVESGVVDIVDGIARHDGCTRAQVLRRCVIRTLEREGYLTMVDGPRSAKTKR